jgi:hypothetical protein
MFISKQKYEFSTDIPVTQREDSNCLRTSVDGTVAQQAVGFSNFIYRNTAFLKCLLYVVEKIQFIKYVYSLNLFKVYDM